MNFEFSNRISGVKASAIREILKMMNDPEIISFGGGNPASETFPVEQLKRISDDIFNTCPNSILEYGITEGDGSFKKAAIEFLSRHETCLLYTSIYKIYNGDISFVIYLLYPYLFSLFTVW